MKKTEFNSLLNDYLIKSKADFNSVDIMNIFIASSLITSNFMIYQIVVKRGIAKFIAALDTSIPWHLSAFHPTYKMLDVPRTPEARLLRAYKIGVQEGLKYVYIGNVDNEDYESTYCPSCKKRVIQRSGNIGQFVKNALDKNGTCPHCGYKLEGVW